MDQLQELSGAVSSVALLEPPVDVPVVAPNPAEVAVVPSTPLTGDELAAQAAESLRIMGRRNQIACLVGSVGMSYAYEEVVQRVEATEIPVRTGLFLVTGIR